MPEDPSLKQIRGILSQVTLLLIIRALLCNDNETTAQQQNRLSFIQGTLTPSIPPGGRLACGLPAHSGTHMAGGRPTQREVTTPVKEMTIPVSGRHCILESENCLCQTYRYLSSQQGLNFMH